MHAIVEIAGKQFRVANDDKIKVPLLASKEGEKVNFDKVLEFEEDGGKITFGSPLINNMSVSATIIEHSRDKKIIVFKKKRRKGYQKKNGHRQQYSLIEINNIGAAKASTKKTAATEKTSKTTEKVATKTVKAAAPKKVTATKKTATTKTETKKAAPKKATATAAAKPKTATKSQAAKKTEPKTKAKED
ncbi:MAG: 50S ribosomal protein L21 [Calditrichia bacterium]|nr:50S ribosomal protein L21 [Calditrichia bacterium]